MRAIMLQEMQEVSGGVDFSGVGDRLLGAVDGMVFGGVAMATAGMIIAGKHGGDGGGLLGIGAIGQLVGLFVGTIMGAITGVVDGGMLGLLTGTAGVNQAIANVENSLNTGAINVAK